jgi:hypothetical protein
MTPHGSGYWGSVPLGLQAQQHGRGRGVEGFAGGQGEREGVVGDAGVGGLGPAGFARDAELLQRDQSGWRCDLGQGGGAQQEPRRPQPEKPSLETSMLVVQDHQTPPVVSIWVGHP